MPPWLCDFVASRLRGSVDTKNGKIVVLHMPFAHSPQTPCSLPLRFAACGLLASPLGARLLHIGGNTLRNRHEVLWRHESIA